MLSVVSMIVLLSVPAGVVLQECLVAQNLPNLYTIMNEISNLTEFQFDIRVEELRGSRVSGSGIVEEVGSVDLFDSSQAPTGYSYKVILLLNGNSSRKAVVFLRSSSGLASINLEDEYSFTGSIIDVTDWGFWYTAYIRAD